MWPAASSFIDCVSLTATCTRYGDGDSVERDPIGETTKIKSTNKNYWQGATQTEGLVLIFLYFAAYLTGIGALLERLSPPSDDAIPLNVDDLNATNATALASNDAANESNLITVQVVYWVLLAFYSLVPVAGCALLAYGGDNDGIKDILGYYGGLYELICDAPDDPKEYAEWMEEQLDDNPLFTIIAPFEKKYAWCVVWIEEVEGCLANMCATTSGTKGRFCSKPSRSRAASY